MKKLRLGVIGTCGRGALSDYAHNTNDGVEIVAGMDINSDMLNKFKTRYRDKFKAEVNGYTDYKEMLEKEQLDGVFITSPDFCHEEQAYYALSHGVPVYLEKPMAITIEGCDRLLETARTNKTKLMVGHNMRYMDFTNKMKDLIDSGAIGEVKAIWCRHFVSYGGDAYFRDWHADRSKSTSLLLQKGAHDIDIIHWLAGGFSRRVIGMGNLSVYDKLPRRTDAPENKPDISFDVSHWPPMKQTGFHPIIDVEDHNMIMMQLENGTQACYLQCHYTPDACRNYTIIGTEGRIENYGDYGKDSTIELWDKRNNSFCLNGNVTYRLIAEPGSHGGADLKIIQGFVDYLREEKSPTTTPQASRYAVATGCAGAESIRHLGMPVDVKPLPDEIKKHQY